MLSIFESLFLTRSHESLQLLLGNCIGDGFDQAQAEQSIQPLFKRNYFVAKISFLIFDFMHLIICSVGFRHREYGINVNTLALLPFIYFLIDSDL